jgi:putative NIF3 family GTP cyclohydrolase 1 type 2
VLGLQAEARFGDQDLGFLGGRADGGAFASTADLAAHVAQALGRPALCIEGATGPIRRVAWCTGGAQGYFEAAIAAGAQAFLTGEASEPQAHYARECGASFLACGHHATERYGAPAVAAHVAAQLGLEHEFIDIPNPA